MSESDDRSGGGAHRPAQGALKGAAAGGAEADGAAAPPLPRQAQDRIGDRLKQMYDSVVREPVPDRFLDLLTRLEQTGQKPPGKGEEPAQ